VSPVPQRRFVDGARSMRGIGSNRASVNFNITVPGYVWKVESQKKWGCLAKANFSRISSGYVAVTTAFQRSDPFPKSDAYGVSAIRPSGHQSASSAAMEGTSTVYERGSSGEVPTRSSPNVQPRTGSCMPALRAEPAPVDRTRSANFCRNALY